MFILIFLYVVVLTSIKHVESFEGILGSNVEKCDGTISHSKQWEIRTVDSVKQSRLKSCYHTSTDMSICPEGFILLDGLGDSICYYVKEDGQYPPSCPYPHALPYVKTKYYLEKAFYDKTVWVNAFRNITAGFGHFEWTESGLYGKPVQASDISNPTETNLNCLVFSYGQLHRADCFANHTTICFYSIDYLQNSYLNVLCKGLEYNHCIIGNYNLENPQCFCKKINRVQPSKIQFCNKLAELVLPYQTSLMTKYFSSDSSMCWIGLQKNITNKNFSYKWLSTYEDVKYTWWAKPEDCSKSEGSFKFSFSPYGGWVLATDRTLNCAICEFVIPLDELSLELRYFAPSNDIQLLIKNQVSISTLYGVGLHCFSDINNDDFKILIYPSYYNITQNVTHSTVTVMKASSYPGHYWCESFSYTSNKVVRSNAIVAYNKNLGYGNEFVIFLNTNVPSGLDPFINRSHIALINELLKKISASYDIVLSLRPMRGYFDAIKLLMNLTVHLTTKQSSEPVEVQYKKLLDLLQILYLKNSTVNVTEFLSSEVCLPTTSNTADKIILHWPTTRIGARTIPSNVLCLDKDRNMLPVTRKCAGDFLSGATWENQIGDCYNDTVYSEATENLFSMLNSNTSGNKIMENLTSITTNNENRKAIDVHLISSILKRFIVEFINDTDIRSFSNIVSNLMNFNRTVLQESQDILNSTDNILAALDEFTMTKSPTSITCPKLITIVTELKQEGVIGLALLKSSTFTENLQSYKILPLYRNSSIESVPKMSNLDVAVIFPTDIFEDRLRNKSIKVVVQIFYNNFLFNEVKYAAQPSQSRIISIAISVNNLIFKSPIRILFRTSKPYLNFKNCSHWKFGLDSKMISDYGSWKYDQLSKKLGKFIEICEYFHLTHFGLILQGPPKEGQYNRPLEILIIIGSALSLIGIIPIFFTAICFKSWRYKSGNIILLNFCIAIMFEIIITFLLNTVKENGTFCTLIGGSLHYMDLSEFCWMFVIAFLQYKRFVVVFNPQGKDLLGKCLIMGWIVPLVPVILTLIISPSSYSINWYGYCYVVGNYFTYVCVLPILLILLTNATIFIVIMWNVCHQSLNPCLQISHNHKLEILLALFLFFALGLTWSFGIIGALGGGIIFIYLFCATATLRGLILFLYFIAVNKEIRLLWKKRFNYYLNDEIQESSTPRYSNSGIIHSE